MQATLRLGTDLRTKYNYQFQRTPQINILPFSTFRSNLSENSHVPGLQKYTEQSIMDDLTKSIVILCFSLIQTEHTDNLLLA
jgi:hypothetical protein